MTDSQAEALNVLAGEYVLGLLDREAATRVERRAETELALRDAIGFWQNRLLPLTVAAPPVQPTATQWAAIEHDLTAKPATARTTRNWSLWSSVEFWRWTSALAVAGVVALAYVAVFRSIEPDATFIAVLTAPDGTPGWVVQAERGKPLRLTPRVDMTLAPDRSLQFWTLLDRAKGPVSLGLVTAGRPLQVAANDLPGLEEGQLFEITSEPYGGSPVGRPTGAILYKGLAVRSR